MRLLVAALFALSGCVCGTTGGTDSGSGQDGGHASDAGGGAACSDGALCDGGLCAGGVCCATDLACGSQCCATGSTCFFLACVVPGALCRDTVDCPAGQFCDLSNVAPPAELDAGQCGGVTSPGVCLPQPPQCGPDAGAAAGVTCLETCAFSRTTQAFNPTVKYSWGDPTAPGTPFDVMMAPIVTELDDDDCDGVITARDMPDIVVTTFTGGAYTAVGTVHALSVKNGQLLEKWSRPGVINAASQLAAGNIDGQPGTEVVGCGPSGVVALNGVDGTTRWTFTGPSCTFLAIADLDGDGLVEVITDAVVLDGRDGTLELTLPGGPNVVADLDGDGQPDIIGASWAVRPDGGVVATAPGAAGTVAVADLNHDGKADVVAVDSSTHTMSMWTYDATTATRSRFVRQGIDVNAGLDPARCPAGSAGSFAGGGPPTVGDFNGDGWPDVALAGGVGFTVFNGVLLVDAGVPNAGTTLWAKTTQDCSSAVTGSTLFDFDGDGQVEAVYGDEVNLHVYEGATGNEIFKTCNTSGTLFEFPVVADIDNDGQADLVVVSNAYALACENSTARYSGVRVFTSADHNWVQTRRAWNQHAYSVTNIEEDGTVPRVAATNWLQPGLNNFRQQKQPGGEFAAADAVLSVVSTCDVGITWQIVLRNVGQAPLPAGVKVQLVTDPLTNPAVYATVATTRVLGPAQSQTLVVTAPDQSLALTPMQARIVPDPALRECRTDNNTSEPPAAPCLQ